MAGRLPRAGGATPAVVPAAVGIGMSNARSWLPSDIIAFSTPSRLHSFSLSPMLHANVSTVVPWLPSAKAKHVGSASCQHQAAVRSHARQAARTVRAAAVPAGGRRLRVTTRGRPAAHRVGALCYLCPRTPTQWYAPQQRSRVHTGRPCSPRPRTRRTCIACVLPTLTRARTPAQRASVRTHAWSSSCRPRARPAQRLALAA